MAAGTGGAAGAGGAGGEGGGGGAAGAGAAGPQAGAANPSGTVKSGVFDVLDAKGNMVGEFARDGKPAAPKVDLRQAEADDERDPAPRPRAAADKTQGRNAIEPDPERERRQPGPDRDQDTDAARRAAPPRKARAGAGNKVASDEIFTAEEPDLRTVVPPDVERRYLRVGNKFYHPKYTDLVAFEDKGNKLETRSDSESIAEAMVRIAQARGWDEIKVSGSETFRREAWLEAAVRGMQVRGYVPSEQDKVALARRAPDKPAAKESDPPGTGKKEAAAPAAGRDRRADSLASDAPEAAVRKHPELAGAYAAMAAVDRQAEADGLTPQQRAIIGARVRQNAVNSVVRGRVPDVKIREEAGVWRERDAEPERS